MEWKWYGKGMEKKQKSSGNKLIGMGMELGWKWNGKLSTEKDIVQWNGNRMEMEWKWNGTKYKISNGSKIYGMEWKWNGKGMEMKLE